MDHGWFDDLTRSLGGEGGTRRALLRVLTGGALGAFPRFGLAAATEGKPRKPDKGKGKDKGTGKGKNRDKKRCDSDCFTSGGHCCRNDTCAKQGSCCPDEKPCGDVCIRKHQCCTETHKPCGDGTCIAKDRCCQNERRCEDGGCQLNRPHFCCEEERECDDGSCVPAGTPCKDEKVCGDRFIPKTECCELDPPPLCDHCHEEFCNDGEWGCRPINPETCPPHMRFDCESGQCTCRDGWENCAGKPCQCYVADGMQCMGGVMCCHPSRWCEMDGRCCFGDELCTPEGCCPSNWIRDGHCHPPE